MFCFLIYLYVVYNLRKFFKFFFVFCRWFEKVLNDVIFFGNIIYEILLKMLDDR